MAHHAATGSNRYETLPTLGLIKLTAKSLHQCFMNAYLTGDSLAKYAVAFF